MITTTWQENENFQLVVRPRGLALLRIVLGAPMLAIAIGAILLFLTEPFVNYRAGGWSAVGEYLPALLLEAVFIAIFGGLGWWILFLRKYVILDRARREAIEVMDWRFGRKQTVRSIADFSKVRAACESISDQGQARRRETYANSVRLVPLHPRSVNSFEVAAFPEKERALPEELARLVGTMFALPVELKFEGASLSPEQETAQAEDAAEDEGA
jgi:hypothetical protein